MRNHLLFMHTPLLSCVLVLAAALPASAQTNGLLTPFIGLAFDTPSDEENRLVYGGAIGFAGPIVGFEVDYGYSPNFFEPADDFGAFGREGSVTTLMGNVLVSLPNRSVKPYFTAGLGLLRTNLTFIDVFDDVSRNDLGINIGGGLMLFLGDNVAIRGDLRQFRNLTNDDPEGFPTPGDFDVGNFRFWRGTAGLTLRF